jgi:uncharacterized protein (DUF58 family)
MISPEWLRKARSLEIKTKRLSRHILPGEYHSAYKGAGMTFGEIRSYSFGDDVRHIDWNVTARTGHPQIKVFREERELRVMLVLDVSASSLTGSGQAAKLSTQQDMAALIAFAALQNHDRVGLILFSDTIEGFIPPRKGSNHLLRLISTLSGFVPSGKKTNISQALQYLYQTIRKRSVCFLISDFQDDSYEQNLRIAAQKHDITCIRIFDPMEKTLPEAGLIRTQHPETGQQAWIDSQSPAVRQHYAHQFTLQTNRYNSACAASGVNAASISTDEAALPALVRLFKQHRKASSQDYPQGFVG